jgi:hypothetical protein
MAPAVATPPPPADGDGLLDCRDDSQFETTSDLDVGMAGYESPQRAVEIFLLERALAFEIRTPSPTVGTVVVDGQEVLRAEAEELADGLYRVVGYSGCAEEPFGPDWTTPALAQPCPDPGVIYSEEPVGPLEQTGAFRELFDVVVLDGGRGYSLRACWAPRWESRSAGSQTAHGLMVASAAAMPPSYRSARRCTRLTENRSSRPSLLTFPRGHWSISTSVWRVPRRW